MSLSYTLATFRLNSNRHSRAFCNCRVLTTHRTNQVNLNIYPRVFVQLSYRNFRASELSKIKTIKLFVRSIQVLKKVNCRKLKQSNSLCVQYKCQKSEPSKIKNNQTLCVFNISAKEKPGSEYVLEEEAGPHFDQPDHRRFHHLKGKRVFVPPIILINATPSLYNFSLISITKRSNLRNVYQK